MSARPISPAASSLEERPLPQNLDAERAILGAVLLDNASLKFALQEVRTEDFLSDHHRRIFDRMVEMDARGQPIDLITLSDDLKRKGELEAAGGVAYLAQLVDGVPRVTNVEHYARIIKERALLRRLLHAAGAIEGQALEPDADPEEILRNAERAFMELCGNAKQAPSAAVGEWPVLELDALVGLAGEFVQSVVPHTEADPAAILFQFLCAVGNLFGHSAHVPVESDRQTANLSAVVVAQTGSGRKGTAWGRCRELLEQADPAWAANCIKSGLSSGEGLIYSVRDPREKLQPILDGKGIVGYESVEDDAGVKDKRLLVIETEFSSVLKMAAREGNILSNVVRQAYDTGTLRILTKNNPCQATGAHISILGHITPDELLRYLSETELGNGFANRFLWAYARRSKCLPDGGAIPRQTLAAISQKIRTAGDFAKTLGPVLRDAEAREIWHRVYPVLSAGHPGLVGSILGRAEAQVTRLSLIYALLDASHVIRREHLIAALACWEYCAASVRFIFGDRLRDPIADAILESLRTGGPKTRTEISALFSRHYPSTRIGAALKVLAREGLARMERIESANGRPPETWRAVGPGEP